MFKRKLYVLVIIFLLVILSPMQVFAKTAKIKNVIKSNNTDEPILGKLYLTDAINNFNPSVSYNILTGRITADEAAELSESKDSEEPVDDENTSEISENSNENKDSDNSESTDNVNGIPPLDGRLGDCGRVIIPWGNYSAAIFSADINNLETTQDIVDAEDSANFLTIYEDSTPILGDHSYQGLNCTYNAVEGESRLYIYTSDTNVETFVCSKKFHGHNVSYLTDLNFNDLSYADTDLVVYTCDPGNHQGYNVTISYWENITSQMGH